VQEKQDGGRNSRAERGQALHEQGSILATTRAVSQLKRMLNYS
jgi:hypothetical protein